jgi:hypothetical protein
MFEELSTATKHLVEPVFEYGLRKIRWGVCKLRYESDAT